MTDTDTNVLQFANAVATAPVLQPNWPEPTPLPFALPDVPAFDPNLLPTMLRPWLEDIADRMQVPPDFVAIPAMVAAGSLIGAKLGVRPQALTTWTEPANLWGCLCSPPGSMKSPAFSEVLAPIRKLDALADKAYEAELSHFEDRMTVYGIANDVAKKRARKAIQEEGTVAAEEIMAEAREPSSPVQKRYLITDATVEAMGEICADNPDGIMVYRDELLTLLSDLESEDKSSARGFLMTGWTGSDFYSFDRISRGKVRIPRVNISLVGTTQPTRLAKFIRGSLGDKNDGMVQRLQLLAWPDVSADWRNVDRAPHAAAKQAAYGCFDQLASLNPEGVGGMYDEWYDTESMPYLRFDDAAVERFVDYRQGLEALVRGDEIAPALADHMSKYRGMIARLALITHLANGDEGPVSDAAVATAIGWAKYLEGHARRAYGSVSVDNCEAARSIWSRIEKGQLANGFTERDIYSRHWSGLGKGKRLTEGLKLLVEHDWLSATTTNTGGRPSTVYQINPKATHQIRLAA